MKVWCIKLLYGGHALWLGAQSLAILRQVLNDSTTKYNSMLIKE